MKVKINKSCIFSYVSKIDHIRDYVSVRESDGMQADAYFIC